jgi:2-dehydro-3-deoxyglucarate aldolase/4-hydroxy-2-oxoheptanedioate aldolase
MDLSASMGLTGSIKHEKVVAACDRVIHACKAKAMPCGISIGPGDLEYFKSWLAKGINFISCGDDISFLQMGARRVLECAGIK